VRETAAYPGSEFLDMVIFVNDLPHGDPRNLRLWLRAEARDAEIEINARRFSAQGRSSDGMWVDYGTFPEDPDELGLPRFGIIRFYGLRAEQAMDSWCVLTSQTDIELTGSIDDAERALQGICRADVGHSTLSPSRAAVGSAQTFVMTYTAGSQALGAGTLLKLTFPKSFSKPQTESRDADGWLTPLDGAAVTLISIDTSVESHERIDVLYRLERELPTGQALRFEYHTRFVHLFPMVWKTMERRYWWSHLPVMAPAVAVDGRKVFVPPLEANGHGLEIEPGPVERLFLFLPGRVPFNSEVKLTGLFTDRYRNIPARSPIPTGLELRLEGEANRTLGSIEKHFTHWYRFQMSVANVGPGVYRVSAVDKTTGQTIARSNPLQILEKDSALCPIYWGEIHAHSEQSDGSGDYHNMFVHANECGSLDFAAAADHACYHTDNEWQWMQDVVNAHSTDGEFVTLIGYEWAGKQGHRNVYTTRDRLDLFRGMTPGQKTLDVVYDHFDGDEEIVAGPHVHHTRDFYDCHNPNVQRFMEIYSMWGNHEERAYSVLSKGARIGFTGGGDCHEGRCGFSVEDAHGQGKTPHTFAPRLSYRCGLTAALIPRLTRSELLQALRNRKTYATTGARVLLDVSISGASMGEELSVARIPEVAADIHACGPIARVDVIKNGHVVHSVHDMPEDASISWQDASGEQGWYVVRITQADDQKAWSSPVWVHCKE
jgi:hypothetical protein